MRIAIAVALAASTAAAQRVTVRGGGRSVEVALAALPPRIVAVADPTDGGKRREVEGVAMADVLGRLAAPAGSDGIAVRCDDGWLSLVPLGVAGAGLLATRERDGRAWRPLAAPRGPVFLVWPDAPKGAEEAWAWGVAVLEYVRLDEFVGPLAPPSDAGRPGMALFRRHCLHCHAIRGAGGMVGWDLATPNVLTYRTRAYVRAYVNDSRRKNPLARMPAFAGKLSPSEIEALIAYFAALAP